MSYIGQTLPADSFQGFTTDTFTGDGSATTFTLSKAPFSEDSLIVVVDNVIQQPTTNFTVSGTTLTIVGTAILSGITGYAIHTGGPLPIGQAASLDLNGASDQLILDADADTTISADTDDQIDIKIGGTDALRITGTALTGNALATIGATGTASSLAGIPFFSDTTNGSMYTHDVSGTDSTAVSNTAYGLTALDAITTGDLNTIMGHAAATALDSGAENVAIGANSMAAATSAGQNTCVGYNSGAALSTGALYNVLLGHGAGLAMTSGNRNVAIGVSAMDGFDTEQHNIGIGVSALGGSVAGGEYNVAIGNYSLDAVTSGDNNVAVGYNAGTAATTSGYNTFIGGSAGDTIVSNSNDNGYNVCVGYGSDGRSGSDNSIFIGANAVSGQNDARFELVLGSSVSGQGQDTFTFGRGTTDTSIDLGTTSFTNPSDERYKKDIETSTCGLSFINDLRPVNFKFKTKGELDSSLYGYEENSTESTGHTDGFVHGFIAQEIKATIDKHTEYKGNELWKNGLDSQSNRQRISKEALIPILVNAVKELSAKVKALEDA